jgi:hypothetical protein
VAGGAGGDIDTPVAEEADHDLALIAGQGDGQDVGGLSLDQHHRLRDLPGQRLHGIGFQPGHTGGVLEEGGGAQPGGGGEGGHLSGGLGA